jgi:hypothetical protein
LESLRSFDIKSGKYCGMINCFALNNLPLRGDYLRMALEEWLPKIKEPYWDEIDGVGVKK